MGNEADSLFISLGIMPMCSARPCLLRSARSGLHCRRARLTAHFETPQDMREKYHRRDVDLALIRRHGGPAPGRRSARTIAIGMGTCWDSPAAKPRLSFPPPCSVRAAAIAAAGGFPTGQELDRPSQVARILRTGLSKISFAGSTGRGEFAACDLRKGW
jgi:hypothetical protein